MLFQQRFLDGIASGTVTLAFRRWRRPGVKPGTRLRTAAGVLVIDTVEVIAELPPGDGEALRAGFNSRDELLAELARHRDGALYRVAFHRGGDDPRIALRNSAPGLDDVSEIRRRLARLDAASGHGPWTAEVLELIARNPGTRAASLASQRGRETAAFKADVRKLKELGLTESLEVGYRLSSRGEAFVAMLRPPSSAC